MITKATVYLPTGPKIFEKGVDGVTAVYSPKGSQQLNISVKGGINHLYTGFPISYEWEPVSAIDPS